MPCNRCLAGNAGLGLAPGPAGESRARPSSCLLRELVRKLSSLPEVVKEKMLSEAHEIAGVVGSPVLPCVAFLAPGFPFSRLFEPFPPGDKEARSMELVAASVEELKKRMSRE